MLSTVEGFSPRTDTAHAQLSQRVAQLLRRMLIGEPALPVLTTLDPRRPLNLTKSKLRESVGQEVAACDAIDVHAHCFAAEYGPELMLYAREPLKTSDCLLMATDDRRLRPSSVLGDL